MSGAPRAEVPVGHGQTRRGWVVVACLGYSRAGAGVLVFSTQTEDLLAGIAGCLQRLGALPKTLVWDRQAGIHGHGGRPTEAFAAFCGQLKVAWQFCEPADPQAKGAVERLQGYAETNFEPGRVFANELDFQDQLDGWFTRVNARTHKTLRERPIDRLRVEREHMTALPSELPDTARRWVTRVAPDPYLRVDTNDYSLDPRLVGQRVEVRVDQREITAIALDTGELACRHARVFARHRTITALEHARAQRDGRRAPAETRGRGPAAGPLRRADRMSATSELAHLFRALKAPAAARALPKLADRARAEQWSYEHFAAALLKTETDSRDSHGGQGPHQDRALPRPQDARGVRLRLPALDQEDRGPAPRTARLPRRQRERRPARTARHRQDATSRSRSASAPAWPGTASRSAPRPNGSRCSPTRNATAASTPSSTGCNGSRC